MLSEEELDAWVEEGRIPLVGLSSWQLRLTIRRCLDDWARERPREIPLAMQYLKRMRDKTSDRTHKTQLGEHVLGAFPAFVASRMAVMLKDPNWMHSNPEAIGILFDEFEVGRLANWEGTQREGAGANRLSLNSADKE